MAATTSDAILGSLNKAQRRAVSSEASTVAILAGPGSGKTHTLTSRVVWLVNHVGHQPCDIVVATFTVKASREMKARIGHALRNGRENKIILGTFHSIARRYLAAYGQRIGLDQKFSIADDTDSKGILARICKRLDVKVDVPVVRAWISKKKSKGTSADAVGESKSAKEVYSQALETCYAEYQQHLDRANLLDYDDLLVRCVELLRLHPACVSNIQAVLIDEYQDTNGIQYELMKLFAQKRRRITIVGDPDQSIYGWRSAEIRNLRRFLNEFSGTEEISLEENYRSSSSILDVSLKVIQQDKDRYEKALLPVREKGTRPVLRKLKNPLVEAEWIVSEIKRVRMMSGGMVNFDDFAILLRSSNLSRHIESGLGKAGIAYRMIGGFKFYDRMEIKTVLDYMRIIYQPGNNDALSRIINVPKRGIGDATIKSLLEEAERGSMSLWVLLDKHCRGDRTAKTTIRKQTEQKISVDFIRLIKRLRTRYYDCDDGNPPNLVELIEQLLRDIRFEKFLEDTYGAEYGSRWANVQELVNLAGEFMRDQNLTDEDALPEVGELQQVLDTDVLGRFLANVSLASDKQTHDDGQDGTPVITVSTIHAAKGLEWPIVFIPGVYDGSIPHMRADDLSEERRLLYVAMTRAKALLYISAPLHGSYGDGEGLKLSPFIEDLSATAFLKKGPSLGKEVMTEMARILQRRLPEEREIYSKLPPMFAVEDNIFPVDPSDPKAAETSTVYSGDGGRAKRQKTHHNTSSSNNTPRETVEGWNAPYSTTMDNSSTFTLPGFTTAGAQYAVNLVAQNTAKPTLPLATRPTSNRPPVQRSLLSYGIKSHDRSQPEQAPALPQIQRNASSNQQTARRAPQPWSRQLSGPTRKQTEQISSIAPELSNHKLGSKRLLTKPAPAKSTHKEDATGKVYPHFSSPPKASPEKATRSANEEEAVPAAEQTRPAPCFHATTVNKPPGWRGFKKPAGLGREGIAPIPSVRNPFRPLTINRSQQED